MEHYKFQALQGSSKESTAMLGSLDYWEGAANVPPPAPPVCGGAPSSTSASLPPIFMQWRASTEEMTALLLKVMAAARVPPRRLSAPPGLLPVEQSASSMSMCFEEIGGKAESEHLASTNDSGTRDFHEDVSEADDDPASEVGTQPATTLMVRNIPTDYNQELLMEEWPVDLGYDFFYLPRNNKGKACLGYAFLNFTTEDKADAFREKWQKNRLPHFQAPKRLNISLAEVQGLEANVQALKQKPAGRMKARQCQPIIIGKDGRVVSLDEA